MLLVLLYKDHMSHIMHQVGKIGVKQKYGVTESHEIQEMERRTKANHEYFFQMLQNVSGPYLGKTIFPDSFQKLQDF